MSTKQIDSTLILQQLEHLEKEIRFIRWELAQLAQGKTDIHPPDTTWGALQEAKGLWEREWDAEWETVWEKK